MPKKTRAGDVATVGLVQMSCDPKPENNLKKAIAGINDAAKRGAQIVCLQELFRSQYFSNGRHPAFQTCRDYSRAID
jgi:N-carbamoylputrescine amidase